MKFRIFNFIEIYPIVIPTKVIAPNYFKFLKPSPTNSYQKFTRTIQESLGLIWIHLFNIQKIYIVYSYNVQKMHFERF